MVVADGSRASVIRFLVLFVVACGGGGGAACPLPPKPATSQPFLWKAQKADGPVVWLYGTIHTAGGADVPPAAWAALEGSPKVITELGDVEADPDKTRELIKLTGKGLDQLLPSDDWYDLRDALRGSVKEADLAHMRPWLAVVKLNAKISPTPSPNMDTAIGKRARTAGKPLEPLESLDVQLKALADTITIADLQSEIRNRKNLACANSSLQASYLAGDEAGLSARLLIPATRSLNVERTKAWFPKVEALFASGGGFVAVGLAHLLGADGLPAMLAAAGYTVARAP
jgi:hypothetical protein